MTLGHEKLDVYRLSIAYVAWVFKKAKGLKGCHRHARDQWLRASQSIPLNIAEGNGKRSLEDRCRYFDVARGSALESSACLDVLVARRVLSREAVGPGKSLLQRVVGMLTKLGASLGGDFA